MAYAFSARTATYTWENTKIRQDGGDSLVLILRGRVLGFIERRATSTERREGWRALCPGCLTNDENRRYTVGRVHAVKLGVENQPGVRADNTAIPDDRVRKKTQELFVDKPNEDFNLNVINAKGRKVDRSLTILILRNLNIRIGQTPLCSFVLTS